ncbi:MAG: hypothetical protein [crAssphage sp. isolate ctcc615]|uniref:Uncharacterized protein n=1 Tax=crAssphage sp. isolate ctcc615 TaxID=2989853 RepID=A0A345BP04_9CAUD|nr:MAG: hypothetical protein KNU00_gp36 [crAssphage sp. isolate ctcc615]AXF52175.1 MAG: hypothetical protein [crAssphage sp. isolate ctcc615]
MNENINLCEILKGHEGETFYSSLYGNIKLTHIDERYPYPLYFKSHTSNKITFSKDGKPDMLGPECLLFPSKYQRDWNKFNKENNKKTIKTYNELKNSNKEITYNLSTIDKYGCDKEIEYSPIEKSVLALLKIYQLIEVGYGGNMTDKEWNGKNNYRCIQYNSYSKNFKIINLIENKHLIAFHTEEQAIKFLSYPENVQLLKDYFMVND